MTLMDKQAEHKTGGFDVERIRADFPILSREIHGKPLVYLDNGASAQKPQCVLETIQTAYANEYANVHRGLQYLSNTATEKFELARTSVARFIGATDTDEIIFTANASDALNLVAQSFGGMVLGEGDEVIISIMEHHSNIVPWHFHRERNGAVIKWAPVHDDGSFDFEAFEALLCEKTKVVSLTHMSNVLGTVTPIKQVIELCHSRNIPVVVDGSQAAVHMPVDVKELDADFYIMTGHKLYGPSGIGVLYGKMEYLEKMPPYRGGGEMISCVGFDEVTYAKPPHRFEAGTPAIVQAIGLGRAVEYMMEVGQENIARHEAAVGAYAQEQIGGVEKIRLIGTAPEKGGIVSFTMDGVHAHDISTILDRSGVAVRAGHHCAEPLMERFGVNSTCRASIAMYNTKKEIDVLVEALDKARIFFS